MLEELDKEFNDLISSEYALFDEKLLQTDNEIIPI